MSTVIEKWDEILGIVKKEHDLSDVRFDTWLKPLKVYDVSGNVVTIVASDQVRLSYINRNDRLRSEIYPSRRRPGEEIHFRRCT